MVAPSRLSFLVRMNLDLELENFIVLNENLDVLAFDYYKDYLYWNRKWFI